MLKLTNGNVSDYFNIVPIYHEVISDYVIALQEFILSPDLNTLKDWTHIFAIQIISSNEELSHIEYCVPEAEETTAYAYKRAIKIYQETVEGLLTAVAQPSQKNKTTCPLCGSLMNMKMGKYGEFYSCSKYPQCNGLTNKDGKPNKKTAQALQAKQVQLSQLAKKPKDNKKVNKVKGKNNRIANIEIY